MTRRRAWTVAALAFSALIISTIAVTQGVVLQRPMSSLGLTKGIGYGTALPTAANTGTPPHDGELYALLSLSSAPSLNMYSETDSGWLTWQTSIAGFTDGGAPAAGTSGDIWQFDVTLAAMDGSDTVGGLVVGIANANHTGSSNNLYGIEVEGITGDAQATEAAIEVGDGWDYTIESPTATDFNAATAVGSHEFYADGNLIVRFQRNAALSMLLQGGTSASGNLARFDVTTVGAMDGSDEEKVIEIDAITDTDHTGSNNLYDGIGVEAITSPDTNAIHTAMKVDSGWDLLLTGHATNTAWAATDDPPAGYVGIYIQQGVSPSQDCAIIARLSDGTEVVVASLVTNDVCP